MFGSSSYFVVTIMSCCIKLLIAVIHIIDPSLTWVMMTTSAMMSTATVVSTAAEYKEKVVCKKRLNSGFKKIL